MQKATSTSPLTIGEYPNQKRLTRRFLGELFPKTTIERNELKAYCKGHQRYSYGMYDNGQPVYYPVRQEYFYV